MINIERGHWFICQNLMLNQEKGQNRIRKCCFIEKRAHDQENTKMMHSDLIIAENLSKSSDILFGLESTAAGDELLKVIARALNIHQRCRRL